MTMSRAQLLQTLQNCKPACSASSCGKARQNRNADPTGTIIGYDCLTGEELVTELTGLTSPTKCTLCREAETGTKRLTERTISFSAFATRGPLPWDNLSPPHSHRPTCPISEVTTLPNPLIHSPKSASTLALRLHSPS